MSELMEYPISQEWEPDVNDLNEVLIMSAFNTLTAIGKTSSTTEKQYLLEQGEENPALQLVLGYAYNPFWMYFIKKVEDIDYQIGTPAGLTTNFRNMAYLLMCLKNRTVTGDAAKANLAKAFSSMHEFEREIWAGVVKKDLDIGIKAKSINKVFPGLIFEPATQLAKDYDNRTLARNLIVQPKLDGYRARGSTTTGQLFSRNGKLITGYDDISGMLLKLPKGLLLDGELMGMDDGDASFKGTQKSAFAHGSGKQAIYNVFDYTPEDKANYFTDTQADRVGFLYNLFLENGLYNKPTLLRGMHSWFINDPKGIDDPQIQEAYNTCLAEGYEGIMLKDGHSPYRSKRSTDWMKLKPVLTKDLKVTGMEPGKVGTKYENTLGKLIVDFEGYSVGVSGMSDAQRDLWWDNPMLIVGKTIEVAYQEETYNQNDGKSLRFPRFKKIRTDK